MADLLSVVPVAAVDFYRVRRSGGTPKKVTATATVPRLTSVTGHGFIDLDVAEEATPDPTSGLGRLFLAVTDDPDVAETFGWTVKLEGETATKTVSVTSAQVSAALAANPAQTVTVGGQTYPRLWLTDLTNFAGESGASGGSSGSADLSNYFTKSQTATQISTAVTAHKGEADPHPQYALDSDLTTGLAGKADSASVAGKAPLLTPTASKTGAYTAAASDLVMADATTASFTVTLPTLAAGSMVAAKKTDASVNTVTVTLPDSSTVVLRLQGEARTFLSTGSSYTVVSGLNTLSSLDARYFPKPDETGAAVGKIVAVTGTGPTAYGLKTVAELGGGGVDLPTTLRAWTLGGAWRFGAARTDTVGTTSGSATVTDTAITAADQGRPVTGAGIPAGSYVGTVTAGTSFLLSSSPTTQMNVTATATAASVSATLLSAARDTAGALIVATIAWPDGSTGTFTTTTASAAFPGAIDAYSITYVPTSGGTKTVTQPAVTRDAAGAVTAQPAVTVA